MTNDPTPKPTDDMPSASEGGPGANSGAPDAPESEDLAATAYPGGEEDAAPSG
jgi:hypothetical protein